VVRARRGFPQSERFLETLSLGKRSKIDSESSHARLQDRPFLLHEPISLAPKQDAANAFAQHQSLTSVLVREALSR
jgi:hypothetical protein